MLIYCKLLLTAVLWGGTFIAGRNLAGHVGPYSAAFLRFLTASVFLLLFTVKSEGRLPRLERGQLLPVFLLGMTGIFTYNVFFFKGLALIHAGRASLIVATCPVFITVLSALIFRERITWNKGIGVVLSVSGALIVISRGDLSTIFASGLGIGELCIFGCVLSWAAYTLIGKAVMSGMSPVVSVCYSSIAGAVCLLPPALFEGMLTGLARYPLSSWIGIFYLGFFGTVVGFILYYQGVLEIGPMKSGLFINFVPVSAILLGYLLLGEPISISLLLGAVFVCAGVILTNMTFRKAERCCEDAA